MRTSVIAAIVIGAICNITGCSKPAPETPKTENRQETQPEIDQYSEEGKQTTLQPFKIGGFTVEALHVGDVSVGHFNLQVKGGEVKAVRSWVGDENATNVRITKADWEEDHYCAHMEVMDPLPEGAKLWVELEMPDGRTAKGSTPVSS